MAPDQQSPFEFLRRLEQRGRDHRAELPAQDEVRREWAGIGFRLGGKRFVSPMDEVTEILTYPHLSVVPRTKSWVRGIANVRGNLLPIMDLNGYLGRRAATLTRLSRVLVIAHEGLTAGLLVDEVLGMRHFFEEDRRSVPDEVESELQPYLASAFEREDGDWYVFSMRTLARHPQFLKVAG